MSILLCIPLEPMVLQEVTSVKAGEAKEGMGSSWGTPGDVLKKSRF